MRMVRVHSANMTTSMTLTTRRSHALCVALLAFSNVVVAASYTGSTPVVSTGLQNLGNTCYMNAQLQCSFHIPFVRDLVLAETERQEENTGENGTQENSSTDRDGAEVAVAKPVRSAKTSSIGLQSLRAVFRDMLTAARNSVGVVAAPRVLCRNLGIPVFEQQDSQEFWKLLLPALESPQLMDLYQGCYEDYISAVDGSGRERRREEPFLDLSLDVKR